MYFLLYGSNGYPVISQGGPPLIGRVNGYPIAAILALPPLRKSIFVMCMYFICTNFEVLVVSTQESQIPVQLQHLHAHDIVIMNTSKYVHVHTYSLFLQTGKSLIKSQNN